MTPTRRDFLLAGSGLFVFFQIEPPLEAQRRQGYPTDFNAYLRIGADGRVTCLVGKVELGQGSMTALAQLMAEELDVALDSIDMIMGDTSQCPWDMGTYGSLSVRQFGPVLKAAGAEARAVLLAMASERLGVPAEKLEVKDGVVAAGAQSVSYAELVEGRRIERHLANVPVKPVARYQVVGTSPRRKDALEKVTGRAKFAADLAIPGALHARIARPPAHGARLKSADATAALKTPGVRVVRDGDLVAALHPQPEVAQQARDLIRTEWTLPEPSFDDRSIFEHLVQAAPPGAVVAEGGDLAAGEKQAAAVIERTYRNAYVAHAPIETHSAVAQVEGGKATVWAGTQGPFNVQQQVAQALGLPASNVRIITPYVGGGFGGKNASQQAVEAAKLSSLAGAPVQVVWDRAEELFYDSFRPAAVVKVRSGLSGGKIVSWDFKVYCAGDREAAHFYDIPNHRTFAAGGWMGFQPPGLHPFAVGPWRAPSVNTNTFARESQIDVLAAHAGLDPVEFRLNNLKDPRMRRVLEAAAQRFGWKPAKAPSGRGLGVACGIYSGTYVATMAEAAVDKTTGRVQVKRVVCAQDQGVTVSPDGSRQQIEGSIMMGLGYALSEEVRFKDGAVLDRNFDTYRIPRFSWLPKIEAVLIDNPETPASGCGEPPIITMGAVAANAVFDALGVRLFDLPMTPERVKAAIAGSRTT